MQQRTQFVGLRPRVRYRIELGFAFVDDGERLFKIAQPAFERATGPELDDGSAALVGRHATVFCLFDSPEAAAQSVVDQEI